MPKKSKKEKRRNRKKVKEQPKSNTNTIVIAAILVASVGYWALTTYGAGNTSNYPNYIEGIMYTAPVVSADGGKVSIPAEFMEDNKLVFLDLELEEPTDELVYQGRTIPLAEYSDGEVLPLIIMSTPKGKTTAGIRVCEPCYGFSFHIVEKKYLQCDACGTRWNIETLQGVSGGCMDFPPPGLVVSTVSDIEVSLVSTGISVVA
ncbi:MAG: DUF2318 domain-containing protein [Candidatus Bathyarchaeota archaeon]|nr:DUF2318 domain-containing protein [Candidatus Bathyarchaeota archaeon]